MELINLGSFQLGSCRFAQRRGHWRCHLHADDICTKAILWPAIIV